MTDPSKINPIVHVQASAVSIVQKYIRQCQKNLPEFYQALKRQDFSFLIQEAHKIKGTGALMGVMNLNMLGERIEIAARENNLKEVHSQLDALAQYLNVLTVVAQE
ncbi:MAG TPA: Hpt domain-containing protein [Bacteroidota bacterium]|nr:Hpt domain-containing protein [Bacteroidota bacterium]